MSCAGQRRAGGGTRPYLGLGVDALVVAVGSGAERGAGGIAAGDAAALGEDLLALSLADFHLLLLTAAAEFIGLEDALGLEGVAAMLWDVSLSHGGLVVGYEETELTSKRLDRTTERTEPWTQEAQSTEIVSGS